MPTLEQCMTDDRETGEGRGSREGGRERERVKEREKNEKEEEEGGREAERMSRSPQTAESVGAEGHWMGSNKEDTESRKANCHLKGGGQGQCTPASEGE